jgi:hypothetical protein
MRLLDPMPAKSRTQESKKRLERLFGDQYVDLQPITEVDCVLRATGADTGVSIVIAWVRDSGGLVIHSCLVPNRKKEGLRAVGMIRIPAPRRLA